MEKGEAFSSIPPSVTQEANASNQVHKSVTARPPFLIETPSFVTRALDRARARIWREKPFDENRYRETLSATQAIEHNYKANPAQLHAMFVPIARGRSLLRQSLSSPEHFGTTMDIIYTLQLRGGKPDDLHRFFNREIYNFTSNFLIDNLRRIGEAMKTAQDPKLVQKAIDVCFNLSIPITTSLNN